MRSPRMSPLTRIYRSCRDSLDTTPGPWSHLGIAGKSCRKQPLEQPLASGRVKYFDALLTGFNVGPVDLIGVSKDRKFNRPTPSISSLVMPVKQGSSAKDAPSTRCRGRSPGRSRRQWVAGAQTSVSWPQPARVGPTPRPLHENAMRKSWPHRPQRARANPWARMPQVR